MTTGSGGNRRRRLFWLRWNAASNAPQNTAPEPVSPVPTVASAPIKPTDPNLSPLVKSLLGYSNLEFDIPQEIDSKPITAQGAQIAAAPAAQMPASGKAVAEKERTDRSVRPKSTSVKTENIREAQDRLKELEILLRMTSQPDRETCLKLIQDCQFALRKPGRRKSQKLPRQPR